MSPPLPSSTPGAQPIKRESLIEKLIRKSKQQPLVPLGCILTCGALFLSGRALRSGNARLANRMFYWRVAFQGFTVAALLGGAWYYGEEKKKEKSRDEKLREIAKAREQLWIEELERIDQEAERKRQQARDLRDQLGRQPAGSDSESKLDDNVTNHGS